MRRFAPLVALAALACGGEELDTDITRTPDRGLVRAFVLAGGAPGLDVVVTREDEAPVAFARLATPAATAARGQVTGEVSAALVLDGRPLVAATHTLAKDGLHSVFFTGSADATDTLTARWVDESLPTAPDKAHVRYVHASTRAATAVRVDTTPLATTPVRGDVGAFVALAPLESAVITIETDAGPLTVSNQHLAAGAVRTIALFDTGPDTVGLAVFDETATGAPEATTVTLDAPSPP